MVNEMESKADSFMSVVREISPGLVLLLLHTMAICLMIQYCSIRLYVNVIPGNKFINGMLFGFSEISGMLFSQVLVSNFKDITSLYVTIAVGTAGYLIFLIFPQDGLHTYLATFFAVSSVAAWFNLNYLILELRVPPAKVSITSVIVRTVSSFVGVLAPTVAALPAPWRNTLMAFCGLLTVVCCAFLPPAGLYLPSTKKTGKNKVQLIDRQTEHTYLDMMVRPTRDTNLAIHSMSF